MHAGKVHIEERRVVHSARIPTDDRDDPGARHIQQLHSDLERMVKEFGDGKQDLVELTALGMRYAIYKSIRPYLRSFPGENPFHDFGTYFSFRYRIAIRVRNWSRVAALLTYRLLW